MAYKKGYFLSNESDVKPLKTNNSHVHIFFHIFSMCIILLSWVLIGYLECVSFVIGRVSSHDLIMSGTTS